MAETFSIDLASVEAVIKQLQVQRQAAQDEKTNLEGIAAQLEQEELAGPVYEEYRQQNIRLTRVANSALILIDRAIACVTRTAETSAENDENLAGHYSA